MLQHTRPGLMLYFDIYIPVQMLPDKERGQLMTAILEYGMDGTLPQFDGSLAIVWGFIQPKLDHDADVYRDKVLKNRYATYCRLAKERGVQPISRELWMAVSDDDRDRLMSGDIVSYPTTTASTIASADANATATLSADSVTAYDDCVARYASGLMDIYPPHRRGNPDDAMDAVRRTIVSDDDYQSALTNLHAWLQSEEWHRDGGRFVPYLTNWLRNGSFRFPPIGPRSDGRRELDADELQSIARLFADDDPTDYT